MTTHPSALPDQADAGVYRSAAALLRSAPPPRSRRQRADAAPGWAPSPVSPELEADGGSVPAGVRHAAVQLPVRIELRSVRLGRAG